MESATTTEPRHWPTEEHRDLFETIASLRTPDETEQALYSATDNRWWPSINLYLVTWGQNVCRPVYPRCGDCVLKQWCERVGVTRVSKSAAPQQMAV